MKEQILGLIQAEVNKRIENGYSQNQIAEKLNISKATISEIMQGNHAKLSDKMLRKVASALEIKTASDEWSIVKTENMVIIHAVCEEAKLYSRFLAITGTSGQGKTTALKVFEAQNANSYYVLCNVLMSQKSFLQKIAQSIGLAQHGNKEELLDRITTALKSKNKPVLLLDDVGKLKNDVYKILQLIYDECKSNTGIIISGVPFLENHITKLKERDKQSFPELYRRIAYWERLQDLSNEMKRGIAKLHGITEVVALNHICKYVNDLGTLSEVITNAKRIAGESEIDKDIILEAMNQK